MFDSGTSEHMICMSNIFSSYSPCSEREKIKVADGTYSSVVGQGSTKITNNIILHSVFHPPNLSHKIFVNQEIMNDLCCSVKFTSFDCCFQDRSRKTIGLSKLKDKFTTWMLTRKTLMKSLSI